MITIKARAVWARAHRRLLRRVARHSIDTEATVARVGASSDITDKPRLARRKRVTAHLARGANTVLLLVDETRRAGAQRDAVSCYARAVIPTRDSCARIPTNSRLSVTLERGRTRQCPGALVSSDATAIADTYIVDANKVGAVGVAPVISIAATAADVGQF